MVTWLDKQLSTATMEAAVMGTAINYSYHANIRDNIIKHEREGENCLLLYKSNK